MLLFCCHSLFERVRLSVNNTFGLFFTKLSHGFRQVDKVKKGINVIFFFVAFITVFFFFVCFCSRVCKLLVVLMSFFLHTVINIHHVWAWRDSHFWGETRVPENAHRFHVVSLSLRSLFTHNLDCVHMELKENQTHLLNIFLSSGPQ